MDLLAQMSWGTWLVAALMIGVCFFLIIVVLLQRGRGGGLASAFGGGGGSSAFGAKTGDVFTWITVVMAGVFIILACVGNFIFDRSPLVAAPPSLAPTPLGGSQVPVSQTDLPIKIVPVGDDTPVGIQIPAGGGAIPIKISPEGKIEALDSDGALKIVPVEPSDAAKPQAEESKPKDSGGSTDGGEERP